MSDYAPNLLLPELLSRFLDAGDELRWRLSGEPNAAIEDQSGNCVHRESIGCSWRCVRRTGANRTATQSEIVAEIHRKVGPMLFAALDGYGDDITTVRPAPKRRNE